MQYQVFKYFNDIPYRDKNQRLKVKPKSESRSPFPWSRMEPGDWFFVPVEKNATKQDIKSQQNSLRNSAANHGIYIKSYFQNHEGRDPKIRVIHDGKIKF